MNDATGTVFTTVMSGSINSLKLEYLLDRRLNIIPKKAPIKKPSNILDNEKKILKYEFVSLRISAKYLSTEIGYGKKSG